MKEPFALLQGSQDPSRDSVHTKSAIPTWLGAMWAILCIPGLPLAIRIAWEKTFLTWARGPQMVGFSMLHIHPLLAIVGMFACVLLMLWLLPAALYAFLNRRNFAWPDAVMLMMAGLIVLIIVIPDNFFAGTK